MITSRIKSKIVDSVYAKAVRVFMTEGAQEFTRRATTYLHRRLKETLDKRRNRSELRAILHSCQNRGQRIIVYPPAIDWNIPLFQRPQHMAIELSRLGYLFLFCTGNRGYDNIYGFKRIEENLFVTNRYDLILEERAKLLLMIHSAHPTITLEELMEYKRRGHYIIYDYVDELHPDIVGNADDIYKRHSQLTEEVVDLVLTVSDKLHKEMISRFPKHKVLLLNNGVDYKHFHIERDSSQCPHDMRAIVEQGKPIIGYYGALAKWIDYALLNDIAEHRPEWNIVLLGWDYDGSLKNLKNKNNIHYLGLKSYQFLPRYGIWFDVAMIPFKKGDIAKATSPLKLYEYMAMNKPVVATKDLAECYKYQGVFVGKDRNDILLKIEEALRVKDSEEMITIIDRQAKENTWVCRATTLNDQLARLR